MMLHGLVPPRAANLPWLRRRRRGATLRRFYLAQNISVFNTNQPGFDTRPAPVSAP